jgi:diadenosine tetraphosphatase ApaH/serine/threonine PP2A family protein phosphatase
MRYAVLSDIHGNLEALRAVLAACAGEVDGLLCLGDVVGYGADPGACLELIAERGTALVAGNHEHGVTGQLDLAWFNPAARTAVTWTATQLDTDHRRYLRGLPLTTEVGGATLAHGSPLHPEEWSYLTTPQDGFGAFAGFQGRLCFVGHSHRPGHWSIGSAGPHAASGAATVRLDAGRRYIINVGSVGQPRDRDPRACFAVWDSAARSVVLRRVAYDVEAARAKIVRAGLPRLLADRLRVGA